MSGERFELEKEVRLSVYYGILLGGLIGVVWAIQDAYFANHYVQKGLSYFVQEIFFERVLFGGIAAVACLLVLIPAVTYIDRNISAIQEPRLARFALILGGIAWVWAGYAINKSAWFPPVASTQGILGNIVYSFLCLGLVIGLYKLLQAAGLALTNPFSGTLARLYNGALLVVLLICFVGYTGYSYYKLSGHTPTGPNLLLLTIDTLRADHLSCYGYDRETSPTIDGLARRGVRFDQVYAQRGLTWPSLTSIMTSLYPKTHGVRANEVQLEPQVITLAEILKNAGYRTGAFVTNYFDAPNRGFDIVKGGVIGDIDKHARDLSLNWLNSFDAKKEPFFMWLHLKSPHMPYKPPAKYAAMFDSTYSGIFDGDWAAVDSIYLNQLDMDARDLHHLEALYDAEIRSSDAYLQKVLRQLQTLGIADNTLIVFAADHGEELYEHNHYFYHSCSIYDSVLRIPLIFVLPKVLDEGKVVTNQVQSIDITPTILDLLHVPLRPEFEGSSLMPLLLVDGVDGWHQNFSERTASILSTRTPEWKYIYNPDDYHPNCVSRRHEEGFPYYVGTEELYDVKKDPREQQDVADEYPEVARELRGQVIHWLETNKKVHKATELTEEAKERLRALGYIK